MEDIDDDCTTVLKIHKNFDDKFRNFKKQRLDDAKSLLDSKRFKRHLEHHDESELISLKANISQQEMIIGSLEKQLAEEKIFHKKQVDMIMCGQENLRRQFDDTKHDSLKMTSKYETAKEEIIQLKKELMACKEQLSKSSSSTSLLTAQMELEEMREMSSHRNKAVESENERLKNAVTNVTSENDILRVQLKNKSSELRKLESNHEGANYQLSVLSQQMKDLEEERSRDKLNAKQSRWIQSKMERCEELEEENKQLKHEILYLKSSKENLDLLNEKCRSLHDKLERSEKRCSEYNDLQLAHEDLKKKMNEFDPLFNSLPTLRSVSDVLQLIENLNHTNQVYAEANGSLKTSLHKCEDELVSTQTEIQKLRVEQTDISSKYELVSSQFKSLKQKSLLVVKERDSYKNILDAYESEMTQTLDPASQKKFKILEETSEGFKRQCLEKDSEIQRLSELVLNLKRKIVHMEQQFTEQKQRMMRNSNSNSDSGVILSLQEKIVDLQKKLEKICQEKEVLELRIEKSDMQGHYNPLETRVIQMKSTPFQQARENLTRDLEALKEENQTLKMKIKTMLESNTQEDITSRTAQALASIPSVKEKEELQSQLKNSEQLNKRLKEKYEEVSSSFKSMVARLLGYRVERSDSGTYKLASVFADSADEYFIFEESQGDVFTLMENDYLYSFRDLVEIHLKGSEALPAFMSAVTLSLRERQITDSNYAVEQSSTL